MRWQSMSVQRQPQTWSPRPPFVGTVASSWCFVVWFLFGAIFISLWEAKWEQYAMVIATPLCLSAGYGVADALAWLGKYLQWKHSD